MNTLTDRDLRREINTQWTGASLSGLGHYLPPTTITNHDLGKMVDTSDEWISSRTGIRSRRRAGELQATSDLAVEAARGALAEANLAIDEIDLILVMSVNPGFGGQSFIHSQLDKIAKIRSMIDASGRSIHLEVDGGVNAETARLCVEAGADVLVAGSATFKGGPDCYADNIAALKGDGA